MNILPFIDWRAYLHWRHWAMTFQWALYTLLFSDESIEKSADYNQKSLGGHKPIMSTRIPIAHSAMSTFKSCRSESSQATILAHNIHTCHVDSMSIFQPLKMSWVGCSPKLPSCKLEQWKVTVNISENSKIPKRHGLMAFVKTTFDYNKLVMVSPPIVSQKPNSWGIATS